MKKVILFAAIAAGLVSCSPEPFPYPPPSVPYAVRSIGGVSGGSGSSGQGNAGNSSAPSLDLDTVLTVVVPVDYGLSLDSLMKPFGFVNPTVLNAFFPESGTTQTETLKVVQLNGEATSDEAAALLSAKGLQSANPQELAAYAATVRYDPPPYWTVSLQSTNFEGSKILCAFGRYRGENTMTFDEFAWVRTWSPVATTISLPYRFLVR